VSFKARSFLAHCGWLGCSRAAARASGHCGIPGFAHRPKASFAGADDPCARRQPQRRRTASTGEDRAGWPCCSRRWESRLRYRVVNASVSGETTAGALQRLPRALALHRPTIVVLELGGNDGLRGLPLATTAATSSSIIRLSAGRRCPRAAGRHEDAAELRAGVHAGFEQLIRRLARSTGCRSCPSSWSASPWSEGLMQADGIHPTARGAAQDARRQVWPHAGAAARRRPG
jgi:lysophospholipase L1-like esterase